MSVRADLIATITAPDEPGIVARVAARIQALGLNIVSSQQYQDPGSKTNDGQFFMRIGLGVLETPVDPDTLKSALKETLSTSASINVYNGHKPARVLMMVSKFDHCLIDLLYRVRSGALAIDVTGIVSNHRDAAPIAAEHNIPFHHLPVTPDTKAAQENKLRDIIQSTETELVVLARYMQILSSDLCRDLAGKAINIHHSFLPSFKGARPYHQAHERGVKLIGATAHYVTPDLDEGPIIEQNVARVHHAMGPNALKERGKDVERLTLAEAVTLHVERRVLLNGSKTVVMRQGV